MVGSTLTVGGNACTNVVVVSATSITCTTPAGSAGAKDVVITQPEDPVIDNSLTMFATSTGGFTYTASTPAPVVVPDPVQSDAVTAINPASGPSGTQVSISGRFSRTVASILVNGTALARGSWSQSSTAITFAMPVGQVGQTVVVQLFNGAVPLLSPLSFTYATSAPTPTPTPTPAPAPAPAPAPKPTIGSVTPKAGPVSGGTSVTITGANFVAGATVTVGGVACAVTAASATSVTCTTGAQAAGQVNVVVTNPDSGAATAAGAYTYVNGTVQLGPLPANAGLKPGASFVTVDGVPFQINVAPNGEANAIQLTATDWNLKLQAKGENGQPLALDEQNRIIVEPGLAAAFTGTGFMPNSEVYVYAFSESKFMGVIRTDVNGNFTSSLAVPELATGGHTIQLNGLSPKGEVRSASVGVVVQPKKNLASGKVYFAYASSKLDAKAMSAIAAISKKAMAAKGNITIKIVGWAQPTDNSRNHVALSNARAAAVARAMKAAGVKGTYSISGEGLAESNVPSSRYAAITVSAGR